MVAILEVKQPSPLPVLEGTRSAFAWQTGSSVWDRRICSFFILPHKERSVQYHGQLPCVRYYCLIVRTTGFKIRNSPSMMEDSLFFVRLIWGMTTIYMETKKQSCNRNNLHEILHLHTLCIQKTCTK